MSKVIEVAEYVLSVVMLMGFILAVMIFSLVLWALPQENPAAKIRRSHYGNY